MAGFDINIEKSCISIYQQQSVVFIQCQHKVCVFKKYKPLYGKNQNIIENLQRQPKWRRDMP